MPTKLELTRASVDKCPRGLEQLQRGGPVITVTDTRAPPFHPLLSLSFPFKPLAGIRNREEGTTFLRSQQLGIFARKFFESRAMKRKRISTIDEG